jgi:hypothetical protein
MIRLLKQRPAANRRGASDRENGRRTTLRRTKRHPTATVEQHKGRRKIGVDT